MKKNDTQENFESLPFEKALEKLETLVAKMESGKLPLEEMMRYFEEGTALSSLCQKKLKEVEKKIEILVKDDGGAGVWKNFDGPAEPAKDCGKTTELFGQEE